MIKVGSTTLNEDAITHVKDQPDGSIVVFFSSGGNERFTGEEAQKIKDELDPTPKSVTKKA